MTTARRRLTITAAALTVAIGGALSGPVAHATPDAGIGITVFPAVQYDPANKNPPVRVGDYVSISATGCDQGKTVTVTANLNGHPMDVKGYSATGGWGMTQNGVVSYTTNAGPVSATGTLAVGIVCTHNGTTTQADASFSVLAKQSTGQLPSTGN